MNIPEFKTEELIDVLEPFQQELVKSLLLNHSEEEAMQIWINVTGPPIKTGVSPLVSESYPFPSPTKRSSVSPRCILLICSVPAPTVL